MEGRNDFLRGESSGVAYGGARLAAERERKSERGRRVIALGATVEFSRSRTARVPWQGYVLARIRERASERASQRVFASLMLTNEGYIIIGETAERIPFIDLSRNMQEPFYGFVPLVSERSHPERCRNRPGRFATYRRTLRRESHPSPPFRRSRKSKPKDRSLERVRNSRGPPNNERRRSPLDDRRKIKS